MSAVASCCCFARQAAIVLDSFDSSELSVLSPVSLVGHLTAANPLSCHCSVPYAALAKTFECLEDTTKRCVVSMYLCANCERGCGISHRHQTCSGICMLSDLNVPTLQAGDAEHGVQHDPVSHRPDSRGLRGGRLPVHEPGMKDETVHILRNFC